MKKIPTLFEREFQNHCVVKILNKVTPGMDWVFAGEGVATVKVDGSCCAVLDGEFYKRYDCKAGKKAPQGFISCCDPDVVTGHWPGWIKCNRNDKADRWFWNAYDNTPSHLTNGTYEAIGLHFQRNPYGLSGDILEPHGKKIIDVERTFEGIREYLANNYIEGIVFWKDGEPQCKIKRSDFGFEWNKK